MLFKVIGWRLDRRGIYSCSSEPAISKLSATQEDGSLPITLKTWNEFLAWASCLKIFLPENEQVFRGTKIGVAFPTADWLNQSYQKFLKFVVENDLPVPLMESSPTT